MTDFSAGWYPIALLAVVIASVYDSSCMQSDHIRGNDSLIDKI